MPVIEIKGGVRKTKFERNIFLREVRCTVIYFFSKQRVNVFFAASTCKCNLLMHVSALEGFFRQSCVKD